MVTGKSEVRGTVSVVRIGMVSEKMVNGCGVVSVENVRGGNGEWMTVRSKT